MRLRTPDVGTMRRSIIFPLEIELPVAARWMGPVVAKRSALLVGREICFHIGQVRRVRHIMRVRRGNAGGMDHVSRSWHGSAAIRGCLGFVERRLIERDCRLRGKCVRYRD